MTTREAFKKMLSRIGRTDLLALVLDQFDALDEVHSVAGLYSVAAGNSIGAVDRVRKMGEELKLAYENLTATQERCNALLEENRALKAGRAHLGESEAEVICSGVCRQGQPCTLRDGHLCACDCGDARC